MVTVIGEYNRSGPGALEWRLGKALNIEPAISSRGLDENALAELADGRIAAICRGDNSMFPEKPGYKWLSFSQDDGETWSAPVPLPATGGDPIESGANGSALCFAPSRTGSCFGWATWRCAANGQKTTGRARPWSSSKCRKKRFALKRDTIFAVDERAFNDSPRVQMSNFRFYQDRETGDVVIFLTRYGERSAEQWMLADYYRYRVRCRKEANKLLTRGSAGPSLRLPGCPWRT